jgi:cell wall assembly regulator SMI1
MQELTFFSPAVPLDLQDIAHVESRFNIVFPADFIAFMQLYQGATVWQCLFPDPLSTDPEEYIQITNFSEVKFKGHNLSIERWLENFFEMKDELPSIYHGIWLPFGSDDVSRNLCYSLNPETFGQIFLYSPYEGSEDPFEFMSPTLEDFVNALIDQRSFWNNDPVI